MQGSLPLRVRAANVGASLATVSDGVVTQDAQGNTLTIGANALSRNTLAAIQSLALAALQTPLPMSERLPALAAVHVELHGATSKLSLQLALKLTPGIDPATGELAVVTPGTEVYFWQEGEIGDADGLMHKTWWLVDNGVIGQDGLARTASPPFVGILAGGNFVVTGAARIDHQTGAQRIPAAIVNASAIWSKLSFAAMAPTPLMAAGVLGMLSLLSDVSAMTYTTAGAYQIQIPQGALLPGSSIAIPVPADLPLSKPAISQVAYDPKSRELVVSGVNFVPPGQSAASVKLKLWLAPSGDQLSNVTPPGTAPVNGLIWQAFELSPQADGALHLTLPAGVALSQHDIYIERAANRSLPPGWLEQPVVDDGIDSLIEHNAPVVYAPVVGPGNAGESLAPGDAQAVLSVALRLWQESGVDVSALDGVVISVADLASNALAIASGKTITLSRDAAHWGWYLGADPLSDPNFAVSYVGEPTAAQTALAGSAADGHIDLLTTLLAQLGGLLGVVGDGSLDSLMNPELATGVRRSIGASDRPAVPAKKPAPALALGLLTDLLLHTPAQDAPIYSRLVSAAPPAPSPDVLLTTAHSIDIFQPGNLTQPGANPQPVLIGQVTVDEQGRPLQLSGTYTHQIVFSDDGTLAFIAARNSRIYVFDTMTQDVVSTYQVLGQSLGGGSPISSLAVNDGWLYVVQGNNSGSGGGSILRINIDSGPAFMTLQQTLNLPGVTAATAPLGFRDVAINSGRYLAVTAPAMPTNLSRGGATVQGNVYVIDLFGVGADSAVDPAFVAKNQPVGLPPQ